MKLIAISIVILSLFGCEDPIKKPEERVKITIKECPKQECPVCEECPACEDKSEDTRKKHCGDLWPISSVTDYVVPCISAYENVNYSVQGFKLMKKVRCGEHPIEKTEVTHCIDCSRAKSKEELLVCKGQYNGTKHRK